MSVFYIAMHASKKKKKNAYFIVLSEKYLN